MTLEAMRFTVARLLTDPAYRERFFGDEPGSPAEHGLDADEFATLARLDPEKLTITTEGFAGKRFERVASAFPRTLAALELLERGARGRYLATTAFPAGDEEERATFLAFVRGPGPHTPDGRRLLEDLASLEALLYDAPPAPLPSYRYRLTETRPRRTSRAAQRLHAKGPLARALASPTIPASYPHAPAELLVARDGVGIALEDVADVGPLLAACDGTATVEELARAHGPTTPARLQRWLRLGVVEDAAGP
jgi:hypothetical protein